MITLQIVCPLSVKVEKWSGSKINYFNISFVDFYAYSIEDHQKPANMNLHCFQRLIKDLKKLCAVCPY